MKQSEKTQITYDRILNAAIIEFGTKGYMGASLNNICATGIPKGLLYHNFKNKDAIYLACVEHSFKKLVDFIKSADLDNNLEKYMTIRLDFFKNHTNEAHIFFETILQPPDPLKNSIIELQLEFNQLNKQLYQSVIHTITLRQGISTTDALDYFAMLQTMFNGYFSSPIFRDLSLTDKITQHEASLSKLLDFMLFGIAERR
ncbi:MAG: TetR/AcrR family transcriptional regulator [Clostridium sp.]